MAATRAGKPVRKAAATPTTPLLSSPIEEECLSLLLQHPELKDESKELLPEYFQNSHSREIFVAWQQSADLESLKEKLDSAMWEQVDDLAAKELLGTRFGEKWSRIVLRLKKEHLRELKMLESAALREVGASGDQTGTARLTEDGIEANAQLLEIFRQEARANRSARDES